MKIESKIQRAGGSRIDIDGVSYHFKPESTAPDAPHVCDVSDDAHAQRFLSITEGYRIAGKASASPASAPAPAAAPAASTNTDPLAGLDDAGVRAWAKEHGVKVQGIGVLKGAKLREKVREAAK